MRKPVALNCFHGVVWLSCSSPFALAYIALLLPRALRMDLYDRYLLLLFPIALIFLLRLYQDRVRPNLSLACSAMALLFAAFAIAGTHDVFSMYRARQDATNELRAVGIPDTAIDAGFEHNGLTQIERFGYINDPPLALPSRPTSPTPHPLKTVANPSGTGSFPPSYPAIPCPSTRGLRRSLAFRPGHLPQLASGRHHPHIHCQYR